VHAKLRSSGLIDGVPPLTFDLARPNVVEIDIKSRGGRINHVFHPENGMGGATGDVCFGPLADIA